ncbi:MAG TPA: SHOCT domain-containing protein [Aggregatilineales bacterium]|nr:SHOCT domain-containing protein [Aggregatilineales bacterium]
MASKAEAVRKALSVCFPDQERSEIEALIASDRSIKYALEAFRPDEIPEHGMLVSLEVTGTSAFYGFLWITNRHLLFAGAVGGFLVKPRPVYRDYTYRSIRNVRFLEGRRFQGAKIILEIADSPEKVVFASIAKNDRLQKFVDYLQARIAGKASPATPDADEALESAMGNSDFIVGLERLNQLKSQGALTEEEFQAAKKKLLDR